MSDGPQWWWLPSKRREWEAAQRSTGGILTRQPREAKKGHDGSSYVPAYGPACDNGPGCDGGGGGE